MKSLTLKFAALAIVALGSISIMSCEKGENEGNDEIPTTEKSICETIEEIPIEDEELANQIKTCFFNASPYINDYIIINSQEAYDSLFPNCALPKEVDFDSKTLYIIWHYLVFPFISDEISCRNEGNNVYISVDVVTDMEIDDSNSFDYLNIFMSDKPKGNQKVSLELILDFEQPWNWI